MARLFMGGLLTVVVLGLVAPQPVVAQPDQIPSEVSPGSSYDIVKSGLAPDGLCTLWLGGKHVGSCRGPASGPLLGDLTVRQGHPAGPQTLTCQNCRRVEGAPPPPDPDPTTSSSSSSPPPSSSEVTEPIAMPDLIGMTADDALILLKDLGWYGAWNENRSESACEVLDQPDGIALQSPAPGEPVEPDQSIGVDICSPPQTTTPPPPPPGPAFRRQPAEVEIQIATVLVLAEAPVPAPANRLTPQLWILVLVLCVLIIAGSIGLRFARRPRRMPEPEWPDLTIDQVTLRPDGNAPRTAVRPPDGPRHAHRVRLAVHRDPGKRTVQEEHSGRR